MASEEDKESGEEVSSEILEARAVDEAKATADAALVPRLLLNAVTAEALLEQVDGPSLEKYTADESCYVGKSLAIAAGGKLEVPIQVAVAGSMVSYKVELDGYDISFGITAQRDAAVTVVKEAARIDTTTTQKFLVGSIPCMLMFRWDNSFSWMREKIISYEVKVTPPSRESVMTGRRRRANTCLTAVQDDLKEVEGRLEKATQDHQTKDDLVEELKKKLEEATKELEAAEKEKTWLEGRTSLRKEQEKLLQERLDKGWSDE